jgi:hypothetical protein
MLLQSHRNPFLKRSPCFPGTSRQTVDKASFDYENNRNRPPILPVCIKRLLAENANFLKSVSK